MDQDLDYLEYVIRHVFLPPQLPQKDDTSSSCDRFLTDLVKNALKSAATISGNPGPWQSMSGMLSIIANKSRELQSWLETDLPQMKAQGESPLMNTELLDLVNRA